MWMDLRVERSTKAFVKIDEMYITHIERSDYYPDWIRFNDDHLQTRKIAHARVPFTCC